MNDSAKTKNSPQRSRRALNKILIFIDSFSVCSMFSVVIPIILIPRLTMAANPGVPYLAQDAARSQAQ